MSGFPVAAPSVLPSATFAGRGIPLYGSAAQGVNGWANFPAAANVDLAGFDITNANKISGDTDISLTVAGGATVGVNSLGQGIIASTTANGIIVDPDNGSTSITTADEVVPGGNNAGASIYVNSADNGGELILRSGSALTGNFPASKISLISPAVPPADSPGFAIIETIGGILLTTKDPGPGVPPVQLKLQPIGSIELKNYAFNAPGISSGIVMQPNGQMNITAPGSAVSQDGFINITNVSTIAFDTDSASSAQLTGVNSLEFDTSAGAAAQITNVKRINNQQYPPPGITKLVSARIISVTGAPAVFTIDLQLEQNGAYIVVDTVGSDSTSYTINFTGQIDPFGGLFYIRNVSTDQDIRVTYEGTPAFGINAILYPTLATNRTNSTLCVCALDSAGTFIVN